MLVGSPSSPRLPFYPLPFGERTRDFSPGHAGKEGPQLALRLEDPLEKEMATHSSTLAWKIPWTEEPGRLQSMGSLRVGHD